MQLLQNRIQDNTNTFTLLLYFISNVGPIFKKLDLFLFYVDSHNTHTNWGRNGYFPKTSESKKNVIFSFIKIIKIN